MSTAHTTAYLEVLLKNLPETLPLVPASKSDYKLHEFAPSDDWVDALGSIPDAVNRELEATFGPRTFRRNTFVLKERGPGLTPLAKVLEKYTREYPDHALLSKWIPDACRAAENIFEDAGVPLPSAPSIPSSPARSVVELLSDSEDDEPQTHGKSKTVVSSKKSTKGTAAKKVTTARVGIKLNAQRIDEILMGKGKPKKTTARGSKKKTSKGASSEPPKVKRPDTKLLSSFEDDRYIDLEEKEDTRKGGARIEPVLLKVSALYVDRDEPDPANATSRVRCIASRACGTTWACPRNKSRILDHASGCSWLPVDLRQAAEDVLALEAIKKKGASKQQEPMDRKRGHSETLSDGDEEQPDPKQPRLNDTVTSTQTKLDFARFLKKGETDLKQRGNDALVLLVTGCGLPSSMLDSPFFKDFVAAIQPKYRPPSSTKFRDRLVPQEAARLRKDLAEQLKNVRDLTLGFDGGKVRKPRGIYTVTVTTPDGESFLADLNDASGVSHTGRYISTEVLEVTLHRVGPHNFSAVVSDNTGNTKKARELLVMKFPHILNLQDCCHEINLALLQINDLEPFKEMISDVKAILAFMHQSTYSMEHFNNARQELKITTGLSHIVITRFWTYVSAVDSVNRCLPAFRAIVEDKKLGIDIASKNKLFKPRNPEAMEFEKRMVQYLAITAPFARAIKCLEAAHTTPSDVLVYWLAILARLDYLFTKNRVCLPAKTVGDVVAIANQRFKEMIDEGAEDIYLAALCTDPRYRGAPIFNASSLNPLTVGPVRIRRDADGNPTAARQPADEAAARDKIFERVRLYLQKLLRREYGDSDDVLDREDLDMLMQIRNPRLAGIDPVTALEALQDELQAYSKGRDPFERPLREGQTVREWWENAQKDPYGRVLGALGVKIHSINPSSMHDERAMSTITWLNSARRSAQHVKTVRDHITIRQCHIQAKKVLSGDSPHRAAAPAPSWKELEPLLRPQSESHASSDSHDAGQSGDNEPERVDDAKAIQALCEGAKMGKLDDEEREEFTASKTYDLKSPFLRALLEDEDDRDESEEADSSNAQGAASSAGPSTAAGSASKRRTIRPSQAAWDK